MIDPHEILRVAREGNAAFEATLNDEGRRALEARRRTDAATDGTYPADFREEALYDFDLSTAAEALHTLADDIQAECDRRMAEAYGKALNVFYRMEELAREPEHADLIPQLEAMRAAHVRDFGKPIPPKPATS